MNENTTIGGFYSDQHGNGILLHSVCGQVARYIQSVSDAGDNPKLQETLENLKPYVFLGSTRNRICIRNCVMIVFLIVGRLFLSRRYLLFQPYLVYCCVEGYEFPVPIDIACIRIGYKFEQNRFDNKSRTC